MKDIKKQSLPLAPCYRCNGTMLMYSHNPSTVFCACGIKIYFPDLEDKPTDYAEMELVNRYNQLAEHRATQHPV